MADLGIYIIAVMVDLRIDIIIDMTDSL